MPRWVGYCNPRGFRHHGHQPLARQSELTAIAEFGPNRPIFLSQVFRLLLFAQGFSSQAAPIQSKREVSRKAAKAQRFSGARPRRRPGPLFFCTCTALDDYPFSGCGLAAPRPSFRARLSTADGRSSCLPSSCHPLWVLRGTAAIPQRTSCSARPGVLGETAAIGELPSEMPDLPSLPVCSVAFRELYAFMGRTARPRCATAPAVLRIPIEFSAGRYSYHGARWW